MSRYDPARDCFTTDPSPTPTAQSHPAASSPPPKVPADSSSPEHEPRPPASSASSCDQKQTSPTSSSSPTQKRKATPSGSTPASSSSNQKRRRPDDNYAEPRYRYNSPPPIVPADSPSSERDPRPPASSRDQKQIQPTSSSPTRKRKSAPSGSAPASSSSHQKRRRPDDNHAEPRYRYNSPPPIVPADSPSSERDPRPPASSRDQNQTQPTSSSLTRKRKSAPSDSAPASSSSHQKRRRPDDNYAEPRYRYNSPPPPLVPKRPVNDDLMPPPSRPQSPPRQRKRPGAASRLSEEAKAISWEAVLRREAADTKPEEQKPRVEEQVRSHYNEKRELGRQWRQTSSRIKGLRSFNNWVKSCLIQKFSPVDGYDIHRPSSDPNDHLVVLDMGCGKGGDLLKWKNAPQEVGFYLGVDTADVSIAHARDRYESMLRDAWSYNPRHRGGGRQQVFQAQFHAMDCWTNSIGTLEIARRIGVDPNVGPDASRSAARWGQGGGFDVVSMMFCMHYAFETEAKARCMLKNVAGALKKGGRFIGTIPSSDIISSRVARDTLPASDHGIQEWGNSIYRVKFTNPPPRSGVFRPTFGWQYNFFLEEAVEEVPEYVVPWEAFRGIAEDYGLELEYKKLFHDVWNEEKRDHEMQKLAERMGVMRNGELAVGEDEWEACGFYLAFSFKKT